MTTRGRIVKIIDEMEALECVISVSRVAKEAGISHSAIFNRYSDLAKRIKAIAGKVKEKDVQAQLTTRLGELREEKGKRAELREELGTAKEELRKVNSVNAALQLENASLKAQLHAATRRTPNLRLIPETE